MKDMIWSTGVEKGLEDINVNFECGSKTSNPTFDDSSATHLRKPYPLLKLLPFATDFHDELDISTRPSPARSTSSIEISLVDAPCEHADGVKRKLDIDAYSSDDKENKRQKKDASPTKPSGSKKLPPKLEEFIPEKFFPDILLVHDVDDCASGTQACPIALARKLQFNRGQPSSANLQCRENSSEIVRYKRVSAAGKDLARDTSSSTPTEERMTASLLLSGARLCGTGKHSSAYRANFTLPAPLATNDRSPSGEVVVIAKVAFPVEKDRLMLHSEARILETVFAEFNQLQQETCGCSDEQQLSCPTPKPPSVPKYYGYFIPEETSMILDGTTGHDHDRTVSNGLNKSPTSGRSPILLMEDCGEPILAGPGDLGRKARKEIPPLFARLHATGILQNSPYERNILVQPGHLALDPAERSLAIPSFRIIDFGRGRMLQDKVKEAGGGIVAEKYARLRFADRCESERKTLSEELKHHFYLGCRES